MCVVRACVCVRVRVCVCVCACACLCHTLAALSLPFFCMCVLIIKLFIPQVMFKKRRVTSILERCLRTVEAGVAVREEAGNNTVLAHGLKASLQIFFEVKKRPQTPHFSKCPLYTHPVFTPLPGANLLFVCEHAFINKCKRPKV